MRKRRFISMLMTVIFCLTMIAQPVFASKLEVNNQVDTILNSKAYITISSKLEMLGYKSNLERISSETVEQLPCKKLDRPVAKVIIPFSYQDKTVDLLYVRDGEQEIVGVGIKMDELQSKSMVEKMLQKKDVKEFISKLRSEGYEVSYKNVTGVQRIISSDNIIKDSTNVISLLTKNNEEKGLVSFGSDGTILAITNDKAYLLEKDGKIQSKNRSVTPPELSIQSGTCNLSFASCMQKCLCSGSPGECVILWGTCSLSCCACFATGNPWSCGGCLVCLGGFGTCLYNCW